MDGQEYVCALGKVVGNFHALETALRLFLCEATGDVIQFPNKNDKTVRVTYLTNYKSLSQLISDYNGSLTPAESAYAVDLGIVRKRDAIAHGRVVASKPEMPITLFKFGRADSSGMVKIEFFEELDATWLEATRSEIRTSIDHVLECAKGREYKTFT
jgi:hypothetical protein